LRCPLWTSAGASPPHPFRFWRQIPLVRVEATKRVSRSLLTAVLQPFLAPAKRGIAAYRAWVPFERIRPAGIPQEKWEEAFAWPANNEPPYPPLPQRILRGVISYVGVVLIAAILLQVLTPSMSAFGGIADINSRQSDVSFRPKADMSGSGLLPCNLTVDPHSVGRKSLL
jgi:hypothetical protein